MQPLISVTVTPSKTIVPGRNEALGMAKLQSNVAKLTFIATMKHYTKNDTATVAQQNTEKNLNHCCLICDGKIIVINDIPVVIGK